jgi:hypothetical protein
MLLVLVQVAVGMVVGVLVCARNGEFPACFFSKEGERAYDRSFAALVKDRGR